LIALPAVRIVLPGVWPLLVALLVSLTLGACASTDSRARTPASADDPTLLEEVLSIVRAQYVVEPTVSKMRFGGLKGLEAALPKDSFRVEGDHETSTVLYGDPGHAVRSVRFTGSSEDEVLRDLASAVRIARGVAPMLSGTALEHAVLGGVLKSLDPHSAFLDPDRYREIQMETTGSFGGLGIELAIRDDLLTVVAPIEGTPASRAGIRAGDRIVKIDGLPTAGMSVVDAVRKMRGPRGTRATITIRRESGQEPRDVSMVREIIQVQSIKTTEIEPGLGYVRIRQFQERTAKDMEAGLEKLEQTGRFAGLILDLRNNPGGLLTAAVEVSEKFLGDGKLVVYTEGRVQSNNLRFVTRARQPITRVPIVVLVNQGSASASEIVAAALQDHGRGVVLGTRTFRKGSIQTIIPLSGGSGLRLTTAMYFTPKGRPIQDQGVDPDVVVDVPTEAAEAPALAMASEAEQQKHDVQLQQGLKRLKLALSPTR
jgi:carboxyl-terminal processing protease